MTGGSGLSIFDQHQEADIPGSQSGEIISAQIIWYFVQFCQESS